MAFHIVVCGGIAPDPLQTLEPVRGPAGWGLKNEMMLPAVLDPWAAHALYESTHLARQQPGSKIWLVSLAPKAKLQQVMMTLAQKAAFELVAVDAPAGGFTDSAAVARLLSEAVSSIDGLDRDKLLLCGGWESATRGAGVTMHRTGELLGITEQFAGVDNVTVEPDGALRILERIEGGRHLVSRCSGPPVVLAWATGTHPEPPNNPQVGMTNMRGILPALQKARPGTVDAAGLEYSSVAIPPAVRQTRVVKDMSAAEIAREIVEWIGQ